VALDGRLDLSFGAALARVQIGPLFVLLLAA
jgi:hypothetical protein